MIRSGTLVVGAATLAALVTVGACSNAGNAGSGQSTATTSTTTSVSANDSHNEADAMFAQHMIPHHQQAVEMSDMLLGKQGIDPRVLDLAKQIKAAQSPEIEQMQTWLKQWGMPTMPMKPGMDMPGQSGMPGMAGMDGMMSQADMSALQNAQGVAAAKLYLTQMIKHHQGAISMAQNEISTGEYLAAIALSHSIVTSQAQEIDTMNTIFGSL